MPLVLAELYEEKRLQHGELTSLSGVGVDAGRCGITSPGSRDQRSRKKGSFGSKGHSAHAFFATNDIRRSGYGMQRVIDCATALSLSPDHITDRLARALLQSCILPS